MRRLVVAASLAVLPGLARAQSMVGPEVSSGPVAVTTPAQLRLTYVRPTENTKLHNYLFDAFGPYPFAVSALKGEIDQATHTPPEWRQDAEGYSRRFASDFGIAAVGTTTRYALSEVFKEDALYYRCECTGIFPRLRHAVVSTLTARRGEDGHRVFSIPALVAPYVGSMTAVYGWYPRRYGAQDAFRMGNYTLLQYVGANLSLEFFDSGSHSLLKRLQLNNGHGAPNPGL